MENELASTFVVLNGEDWSTDNQNLLKKILTAIKLEDKDVQIIPLNQDQQFSLQAVPTGLPSCKVLIFGLTPADILLNIRAFKYRLTKLEKATLLFSDSLTTIAAKPELKKPLWSSLQAIYQ